MMDGDELIERLLEKGKEALDWITSDEGGWGHGDACEIDILFNEAATHIAAQDARIDEQVIEAAVGQQQLDDMANEIASLRAERDALRAAVAKAADIFDHYAFLHSEKSNPAGKEKSLRNMGYADDMRKALGDDHDR